MRARTRHILRDQRGASIVIALVFFLICGIIGSTVVTAASVQAKSVQTHKELQQAEFTVASAAQTIGYDLDMAQLTVVPGEGAGSDTVTCVSNGTFGLSFWGTYGRDVLAARKASQSYELTRNDIISIKYGNAEEAAGAHPTVYARLVVDRDLNIKVSLSLDKDFDPASPYNMTVDIQCIPTYDASGTLKSFAYERAVITKTSDGGAA